MFDANRLYSLMTGLLASIHQVDISNANLSEVAPITTMMFAGNVEMSITKVRSVLKTMLQFDSLAGNIHCGWLHQYYIP